MGWFKGLAVIVVLGLFFACTEQPGNKGILSVNDMKKVMWDVLQSDEMVGTFMLRDSTIQLDSAANVYYQKIFFLHNISQATFFKSFNYYKNSPGDYKILLDSMNNYGTRERDEASKRKMRIDSLKLAK